MIKEYATVRDFNLWEQKAKQMSYAELHWTIKDCRDAAYAMKGWNPIREGYYLDQMHTYANEVKRRALLAGIHL